MTSYSGVSARLEAVERLVAINDEVADPERLEDEIIREDRHFDEIAGIDRITPDGVI